MHSTVAITLLFALCTMIGPLGIDTYLPSFHSIAKEFDVGPTAVQQTLSVYVLAMACTMLFYGTLSDAFGRRKVLMVSAMGYCVTSLVSAFVPSIEALVLMRFLQGLCGGSGMVIVRAMVQDKYQGAEAQRMMALVMMVFGLAPAMAPVFGGWLQTHGGWRATFYFLSFFGAALAWLIWHPLAANVSMASTCGKGPVPPAGRSRTRWMASRKVKGLARMSRSSRSCETLSR